MKLYLLDASDVSNADENTVKACFPKRFERASRMIGAQDRLAVIAAGVLLFRVLGIDDERLIRKNEWGKPFVSGLPGFSISHSAGRCLLAVGNGRIGADIEKLDEGSLIAAEAALTDSELRWIAPSPIERFHILWTRKESIFKATGGFDDPRQIEALSRSLPGGLFVESAVLDGFAISVCADCDIGLIEPINITKITDRG